jgi:hypothetical protein
VIRNKIAIATTKNGAEDFTNLSKRTSAIDETINNPVPTGGVKRPIVRLMQMITPKWIGSISKEVTSGINTGTNMINAAIPSSSIPTINSMMLTSNKNTKGFS